MTATTSRNAFIYGMTESFGETAVAATLTAARYAVIGWDWYTATFFSEAASRRYEWIGQMIATLGYLAFLYGKQARTRYEAFLDAQVAEVPSVAELMTEVTTEPAAEADPFSPENNPHYAPAMAATMAAPVATLVVPVAETLEGMTTAQLRKMAIAHNRGLAKDDPRRIPNAARLTKAQALAALG